MVCFPLVYCIRSGEVQWINPTPFIALDAVLALESIPRWLPPPSDLKPVVIYGLLRGFWDFYTQWQPNMHRTAKSRRGTAQCHSCPLASVFNRIVPAATTLPCSWELRPRMSVSVTANASSADHVGGGIPRPPSDLDAVFPLKHATACAPTHSIGGTRSRRSRSRQTSCRA
jgi:hypothetical protein